MRTVPAHLSPLLLLAALQAQGVVSPRHFTVADANSYAGDALGVTQAPNRYLAIHDELRGGPRTVTRIAFRRDGPYATSTQPGFSILCNVICSTAATTPAQPDATFNANHGSNRQTVGSFLNVQFPVAQPGPMPRPFDYPIPFGSPYAHDGQGALCLELVISSRTNQGYLYFDRADGANANPQPVALRLGNGCSYVANGPALNQYSYGSANWSQTSASLVVTANNAKPNTTVFVSIGASGNTLGGLPLPFELPGTQSAPSGPCTIYNDVLITIPTLANANGAVNLNLGLGTDPGYNGLSVFTQIIAADPAANAWGLVLSNGYQFQLTTPFATAPVGEVFHNSSIGATGTARGNSGYVTRFE